MLYGKIGLKRQVDTNTTARTAKNIPSPFFHLHNSFDRPEMTGSKFPAFDDKVHGPPNLYVMVGILMPEQL